MSGESGTIRIRYASFSILIAIGLTIAIASLWSTQPMLSTPSNTNFWANSASLVDHSLGLRLDMSVNSTSLAGGQGIRIRISEHNEQPAANSLKSANGWKVLGLGGVQCSFSPPIGFEIFKGYHSQYDLLGADLLSLYPIGLVFFGPACIVQSSYNFQVDQTVSVANDYRGTWTGHDCPPYDSPQKVTIGNFTYVVIMAHSWTDCSFSPNGLHPFAPGAYTVAGGDEWGDILILYFTVS